MNDAGVSVDSTPQGPHAVTKEWLSFEGRMRRRRVGRCLLRADLALEDRCAAEARAALDEARQLQPDCPELAELESRLRELDASGDIADADATYGVNAPVPSPSVEECSIVVSGSTALDVAEAPSKRWLIFAAAGAAVLIGGVVIGSVYRSPRVVVEPERQAVTAAPALVPAALTTSTTGAPADAAEQRLRIEQETIMAAAIAPELVTDEPTLPSFPAPPIAPPEAPPQTEPVVLAVNRGTPDPLPSIPETPKSEVRLDTLPSAPPPEPPARSPSPSALSGASLSGRLDPKPADESSIVRGVLARYERAYSTLDAGAASAVWPAVDRGALARAFEGLASQRVSLQACDVTVSGIAAHASCSGMATWVPKVGGGARSAPRRWDFELRKRNGDWEIERAVAR